MFDDHFLFKLKVFEDCKTDLLIDMKLKKVNVHPSSLKFHASSMKVHPGSPKVKVHPNSLKVHPSSLKVKVRPGSLKVKLYPGSLKARLQDLWQPKHAPIQIMGMIRGQKW